MAYKMNARDEAIANAVTQALLNQIKKTEVDERSYARRIPSNKLGSIVDAEFKKRYAERHASRRGKPAFLSRSCGDWLAETLGRLTLTEDGHLNVDRLDAILDANGVDVSHLSRGKPGWQGRLRMTGRTMLAPVVARNGVLQTPDGGVSAPREWVKRTLR